MRSYHTSLISLGPKGGKKGAKKGKDDDDAQDAELPSLQPYQASIARSIAWLQAEFDKNKFGSITPEYFQSLSLPGHGALGKLGQVTVRSGAHLSIAVYDTSLVSIVVDAVRGCGLNLNPVVDGSNVTASVPRATKETRDLMVKNLSKLADKIKGDIRNMRKDVIDGTKKLKGSVSEDDIKRHTKEIEAILDKSLDKVTQMMKAKEKELSA